MLICIKVTMYSERHMRWATAHVHGQDNIHFLAYRDPKLMNLPTKPKTINKISLLCFTVQAQWATIIFKFVPH